jgi:hypothetical protein
MMRNHSFKYSTLRSAEAMPNFEHMHLIANLVDHPIERDFDMLIELIQNSSINILKILSVSSSNGNIIFDPTTLSEAAIHSVEIMKDMLLKVYYQTFFLCIKLYYSCINHYSSYFCIYLNLCYKMFSSKEEKETWEESHDASQVNS